MESNDIWEVLERSGFFIVFIGKFFVVLSFYVIKGIYIIIRIINWVEIDEW